MKNMVYVVPVDGGQNTLSKRNYLEGIAEAIRYAFPQGGISVEVEILLGPNRLARELNLHGEEVYAVVLMGGAAAKIVQEMMDNCGTAKWIMVTGSRSEGMSEAMKRSLQRSLQPPTMLPCRHW